MSDISDISDIDLNLLPALDALLAEGSVTGAARRLGLSTSAMSRTLARLRSMTGDPLLVRAGSGLVPTPRAMAMRDRVREVAREARGLLGPQSARLDLATLSTRFTVRANEGFMALFAAPLVAAVLRAAPGVQLRCETDLVAQVPRSLMSAKLLADGLTAFELPVETSGIIVSAMWHPRLDGEPAHRWLRETLIATCQAALGA